MPPTDMSSFSFLLPRPLLLGLSLLPRVPDPRGGIQQILLRDMVLDALHDAPHRADVVGVLLVVPQAMEAPSRRMPGQTAVGGVIRLGRLEVAFDDAVLQGPLQGFEVLPLPLGDVHGGVVLVVDLAAEVDEEVEGLGEGEEILVRGTVGVVGFRGQDGPGDAEDEVDGVFVRGLPFQDVFVRAGLVGGVLAGEDQAVVAVELFDRGDDRLEHVVERVGELRGFVLDGEGPVLDLFGEGFPEFLVGLQDPLLEAGEAFVQRCGGQQVAVEDEAVEHEEFELRVSVEIGVLDQLAVEDGFRVEGRKGLVILFGEVQARDEVVVVFAVDEVVDVAVSVPGAVHQIANAIGLFADIVVLMSQLGEMAGRERDRLGPGKRGLVSSEKVCNFMAESLGKVMICL